MPKNAIRTWNDFDEFGIRCLTGEACGLNMRLLCDLTAEGVEIIQQFFGGGIELTSRNWNSGAIASILLPRSIFKDLAAFVLLKHYHAAFIMVDGVVIGVEQENCENYRKQYEEMGGHLERVVMSKGTAGDRNIHVATGRIN